MAQPKGWAKNIKLAAEAAADPAEDLPNGAATGVAALIAREDKHLLSSFIESASRRQGYCIFSAGGFQVVIFGSGKKGAGLRLLPDWNY